MSEALDTVRYCGEFLSDNIIRTPNNSLICKNAVIARTGFQEYAISEVKDRKGLLKDLDQSGKIKIYRPAEQVFAPATMASFEGATFTFTHPNEFLNPRNDRDHSKGHAANVRKGDEPLESGEWPLLADIFVKDEQAINAIASGIRELSCGYNYDLVKNGERYEMHNIIGNHVALVDSARAGEEARINDSMPRKENHNVKSWDKFLIGLGFKEYAKTETDPEKISEAMDAVAAATKEEGKVEPPKSQLSDEEKKKAADEEAKKVADAKKAADDDFGKRMHDALETLLQKREEKKASHDADMGELSKLWQDYLGEESKEPEHQADEKELTPIGKDEKEKPGEKAAKDAAEAEAKKKEEEKSEEKSKDAEIVHPEPKLEAGEVPESQFDSAIVALRGLKPFIARHQEDDPKLVKAFNLTCDAVNAGRRKEVASAGGGSYRAVLAATRGKARDSSGNEIKPQETRQQKWNREYEEACAARRRSPELVKK